MFSFSPAMDIYKREFYFFHSLLGNKMIYVEEGMHMGCYW